MKRHEKTSATAYEGEWDFQSRTAPQENATEFGGKHDTFTLGCFQWIANARGTLRPGKVQYRVKGSCHTPAAAYAEAREFCRIMNRPRS